MSKVELKCFHLQVVDSIVSAITEVVPEWNLEMLSLHHYFIAGHFAHLDHVLQLSLALST